MQSLKLHEHLSFQKHYNVRLFYLIILEFHVMLHAVTRISDKVIILCPHSTSIHVSVVVLEIMYTYHK